jgi:hypothetical protein
MSDLSFQVTGVAALANAAVPTLAFRLQIREARPVHSILLRTQLQIEPRRRGHAPEEQERLMDLFGVPERWNETLRPLIWSHSTLNVPGFEGSIDVDLPIGCTYDFEVTAAKYLAALEGGEIPLRFLFSGTVFVKTPTGFMVQQVPWDKEALYRMPVAVWRQLMDAYFPGSAWICVRRETLASMQRFRAKNGLTSWDETIGAMLGERAHG